MSEDLRKHAEKRLVNRRQFWSSSITLVVVFVILLVIWFATTGGTGYFWPMWPAIGFVIAIGFHALSVFGPMSKPISQAAIDAEVRRLGGDPSA